MNRKKFITRAALAALFAGAATPVSAAGKRRKKKQNPESRAGGPMSIATWKHGMEATAEAMRVMQEGKSALDAAEAGVRVTEADKTNTSVGLGGFPDREGIVTLDASIMEGSGRCGSVSFVQGIDHPITLARKVMEDTPHVMLTGRGAEMFAQSLGMVKHPNTLTEVSRKAWENWLKEKQYKPIINIENHDTIGLLALDQNGKLAGCCTTSGLAFKMHGRVGDSPIIGAGLFCDEEVGAATCTGLGETVLRTLASHTAVELMRHGATAQEAAEEAIHRIVKKHSNFKDFQVGILVITKTGEHGAFGLHKGFNYALHQHNSHRLIDAAYYSQAK
ncbi:MAG: N(4)-(beta-N-acetylglucosaminyl)-L-asparaginase [Bacteroidia bacterium]|jgi:isoaspartyl peptidase/L-asparaginase-like protein (Ntn-hydrolase superfamily)|nr:N(4)-(beta-N-acetylglucosaminyl)-L-asparaginase [Bacteroidia bacterium]